MESATVQEGPYIFYATERRRGDWGEGQRYSNMNHLYLGDERLYEDKEAKIGFMDVDETTEAHFVLCLYHPREVQAQWGDMYPQLTINLDKRRRTHYYAKN